LKNKNFNEVGLVMFNRRNRLWIYIKFSITNLFFIGAANLSFVLIPKLSNDIFNTRFNINYDILSFWSLILFPLYFSLLTLSSGIYITKGIRIDDKEYEKVSIKQVMENMKWKLKEEDENTIKFRSPFNIGLWMDEMLIEFIDNEIHITGPREYVKRVIKISKYLYTPYEIKIQKQEG
jgi:hypothetical protein